MLLIAAVVAAILWLPPAWGLGAIVAAAVLELAEIGLYLWYSKRRRATTGAEALVGAEGVAVTACRPQGQVRIDGELWRAVCTDGVDAGDPIVVERVEDGLTLIVAGLHSARG